MLPGSTTTTSISQGAALAQRLAERLDRELGGVVWRHERARDASPDRGDEDDRPLRLRTSGRNAWVTATWPTRFTSSVVPEVVESMLHRPAVADAGVVDEPDDAFLADRFPHLVPGRGDRAPLGHVDRDRREPVGTGLGERLRVLLLADPREHR